MKEIEKLQRAAEPHGITVTSDCTRGCPQFTVSLGPVRATFQNKRYMYLKVYVDEFEVALTAEESTFRYVSPRTNLTIFEGLVPVLQNPLTLAARALARLELDVAREEEELKKLKGRVTKARRLHSKLEKEVHEHP